MAILNAADRLSRIDWNFPKAGTPRSSAHALHWFAGNYIPQIPAALIEVLSRPDDVIFDPFGGSGTTAIEAMRLGRYAILSDRLSACLSITKGKLAQISGALHRSDIRELIAELTFEQQCVSDQVGLRGEGSDPELSGWYSDETLSQLRFLWRRIEDYRGEARAVLTTIFSDVLFDCAAPGKNTTATGKKRRHHWGWIADNVKPRALATHNAVEAFRHRLIRLDQAAPPRLEKRPCLIQQDARQLALHDNSVDLVVTSPPYVGVIDYAHSHRLLYSWMGWALRTERDAEIGARYRRTRANLQSEYLADMQRVRDELSRVVRSKGHCAFVLGESRKHIGTVAKVVDLYADSMQLIFGPIPRHPTRRRVSDRAASDAVEYVFVFRVP